MKGVYRAESVEVPAHPSFRVRNPGGISMRTRATHFLFGHGPAKWLQAVEKLFQRATIQELRGFALPCGATRDQSHRALCHHKLPRWD